MSYEFEIIPTKELSITPQLVEEKICELLKKEKLGQKLSYLPDKPYAIMPANTFFKIEMTYTVRYDEPHDDIIIHIWENDKAFAELEVLEGYTPHNVDDAYVNDLAKKWEQLNYSLTISTHYNRTGDPFFIALVVALVNLVDGAMITDDKTDFPFGPGLYGLNSLNSMIDEMF